MTKTSWLKKLKLNIHAAGTSAALMMLALTQVPAAIKTSAELACIAEVSNEIWKKSQSHKNVNVLAVKRCNGGD